MSVHATASRPARTSVGAAALGLVLTLTIFVAVFLAFILAPLLLLAAALLAVLVLRPRHHSSTAGRASIQPTTTTHGLGAGHP